MDKLISQYQTQGAQKKPTAEEKERIRIQRAAEAMAEKQAKNKKLFLELFQKVMIASAVMEKMEMSPRTYYDWIHDDVDFKNEVLRIERERHANVEDRLFKLIQNGDGPSIRFYLERREPRYKIKSVNEIGPTGFKSLEELIVDAKKKRNEQIAEQRRSATADRQPGADRVATDDTGQKGDDSGVHIEPGAKVVLETQDQKKPDTESETRGDK